MAEVEKEDQPHAETVAAPIPVATADNSDAGGVGEFGTSPTQERSEYNTASDLDDDDDDDDDYDDDLEDDSQTDVSGSLEDGDVESGSEGEEPPLNKEKLAEIEAQRKADEDRSNPQYIPKRGTFYEHDDRMTENDGEAQPEPQQAAPNDVSVDGGVTSSAVPASSRTSGTPTPIISQASKNMKKWQAASTVDRWSHDKFDAKEQAPKSRSELVSSYGYDIRNEEGPPRARRSRRYARGPNKYLRSWEDEEAYQKANNKERKLPKPSDFPALDERPRKSTRRKSDNRDEKENRQQRRPTGSAGSNEQQQQKLDNASAKPSGGRSGQSQGGDSRGNANAHKGSAAPSDSSYSTMEFQSRRHRGHAQHHNDQSRSDQDRTRENNYHVDDLRKAPLNRGNTHKDDGYQAQQSSKSQPQNFARHQNQQHDPLPAKPQHQQQQNYARSNVMHRLQQVRNNPSNNAPMAMPHEPQMQHQQPQQMTQAPAQLQQKAHFSQQPPPPQQQPQQTQGQPPVAQQQGMIDQRGSNLPKRYSVRRGQDIRRGQDGMLLNEQQSQAPPLVPQQQQPQIQPPHIPLTQPPPPLTQQQLQQPPPPLQAPSMQQPPPPIPSQGQLQQPQPPQILQQQLLLQDQHMLMQLYQQQELQAQLQSLQINSNAPPPPKPMAPPPPPPQAIYPQANSGAAYYVGGGVESASQGGGPMYNHSTAGYMPAPQPPVQPPAQPAPPPAPAYHQNYNTVGGTTYYVPPPVQPSVRSASLPQRRPNNAIPIVPPNDKLATTKPSTTITTTANANATTTTTSTSSETAQPSDKKAEGPELRNIEKIDRILDNMFVARPAVKPHRRPPKAPKDASKHAETLTEKIDAASAQE